MKIIRIFKNPGIRCIYSKLRAIPIENDVEKIYIMLLKLLYEN